MSYRSGSDVKKLPGRLKYESNNVNTIGSSTTLRGELRGDGGRHPLDATQPQHATALGQSMRMSRARSTRRQQLMSSLARVRDAAW